MDTNGKLKLASEFCHSKIIDGICRCQCKPDIDIFQKECKRTCGRNLNFNQTLDMTALGVSGEAGEYSDYVKKILYHDHPLDRDHLIEELGDTLWYICIAADNLGVTMSEIMKRNKEKLEGRYPDGFEPEKSINREATMIKSDGQDSYLDRGSRPLQSLI